MENSTTVTEKELVQIIRSTKPIVLRAIQKYLNPEFYDCIDDVAQETYLRLVMHIQKKPISSSFQNDRSLGNFCYTIAKNESIRMNHKRKKEREKLENWDTTEPTLNQSMEEKILDRLEYEELLSQLPPSIKEMVLLWEKGYTKKEAAKKLGIQLATVQSRLYRFRRFFNGKFSSKE